MQLLIPSMRLPTIKSPINYFGGKSYASRHLIRFLPNGIDEVLSPFLGGASFELRMTGRGIRILGYDGFQPLVNFWQVILRDPIALSNWLHETIIQFRDDKEGLERFTKDLVIGSDPMDNAHRFLIRANFSYNGNFKNSRFCNYYLDEEDMPKKKSERAGYPVILNYNRIRDFYNPLLSVGHADFRESMSAHPDTFAYCDPPYPEAAFAYGDAPEYHEEFPHGALAEILHQRDTGWMLSYNNCDTVKQLYPPTKFHYNYLQWRQSGKSNNYQGDEVLIRPLGQPPSE